MIERILNASKSITFLKSALLILTVFTIYSPAFFAPFYFDDYKSIVNRIDIHELSTIPKHLNNYMFVRGLTNITFNVDWFFYQAQPWGFHLTNILFHCLAVLLVWRFVNRLLLLFYGNQSQERGIDTGYWAALFFAVHPMQTEAVTYIVQRAGVLALDIYLIVFLLVLWLLRRSSEGDTPIQRAWPMILASSMLAFAGAGIGAGAKLTAITLPATVLLAMFCMRRNYPLSDFAKRAGIYLAPVAAGIVYLAVFRYSIIISMMDFPGRTVRGMGTNFLTQMKIIVTYYLPRILFPIRLNYDPQISAVESFLSLACLVPIAVIGLLLFIAFRTFKTRPEISFGLLWYFITISPTTSFFSLLDLAAERRVYLPLVGVSLVIGSFIDRVMMARTTIPRKTRIATLALAAVLLAFLTFQRNLDYANPAALWYKSAVMSPKKMRPLCNYVHTLIKQGKDKEALQAMKSGYNGVSPIRRNIEDGYSLEFMVGFMIPNNINVKDIVGIAERYVQNDPKNIRLLEILQSAYLLTKQFAKLEPIVDYTLKLQESNIKSLQNKAMFYRMKGDLVNARNMLVLAWVWSPEYLPVLQELIEVNRLLGRDNSEFLKVMEKIEQRKGKTGDELFYYGSNINTKTQ